MLFAVLFNDFPEMAEVRAQNLAAHLAWLEEYQAVIPVGGSLRREPNATPKGGLWIANAQSKEELDALLRTDPFFTAGLRKDYEILHWSKANPARKVSF